MGNVGRPRTRFVAPEPIATAICEWVACGKSVLSFSNLPHAPSGSTIRRWCDIDAEFAARLARAREAGQESMVEQVTDIADGLDSSGDVMRDRLRCEMRLRAVAAWNPQRWAPTQRHDHTVRPLLTEEERVARLDALLDVARSRRVKVEIGEPVADEDEAE